MQSRIKHLLVLIVVGIILLVPIITACDDIILGENLAKGSTGYEVEGEILRDQYFSQVSNLHTAIYSYRSPENDSEKWGIAHRIVFNGVWDELPVTKRQDLLYFMANSRENVYFDTETLEASVYGTYNDNVEFSYGLGENVFYDKELRVMSYEDGGEVDACALRVDLPKNFREAGVKYKVTKIAVKMQLIVYSKNSMFDIYGVHVHRSLPTGKIEVKHLQQYNIGSNEIAFVRVLCSEE